MGMRVVLTAVASGLLLLSFLLGTMLGDAAHRHADQAALPIVQAGSRTPGNAIDWSGVDARGKTAATLDDQPVREIERAQNDVLVDIDLQFRLLLDSSGDDSVRNEAMNAIQKNGSRLSELVKTCGEIAFNKTENPRIRSYAVQRLGMAWGWDAGRYEKVIARDLVAACESHKSGEIFREALWALAGDPHGRRAGFVVKDVERILRDPTSPDHDLAFRIISEKSIHELDHVLGELSRTSPNEHVRRGAQELLRESVE
jgi:hypothetical protein